MVEYDPADPNTITFEHWFSPTVKSDVMMKDYETFDGAETRELTDYEVQ